MPKNLEMSRLNICQEGRTEYRALPMSMHDNGATSNAMQGGFMYHIVSVAFAKKLYNYPFVCNELYVLAGLQKRGI